MAEEGLARRAAMRSLLCVTDSAVAVAVAVAAAADGIIGVFDELLQYKLYNVANRLAG